MRWLKLTSGSGEPLYLRDDIIVGVAVEKDMTLLMLGGYDIDMTVRERPAQVLAMLAGGKRKPNTKGKTNGIQACNDKPEQPRVQRPLSGIQELGRVERGK